MCKCVHGGTAGPNKRESNPQEDISCTKTEGPLRRVSIEGWGDGSAGKSSLFLQETDVQFPASTWYGWQPSVTPVPGDPTLPSDLFRCQAHS